MSLDVSSLGVLWLFRRRESSLENIRCDIQVEEAWKKVQEARERESDMQLTIDQLKVDHWLVHFEFIYIYLSKRAARSFVSFCVRYVC